MNLSGEPKMKKNNVRNYTMKFKFRLLVILAALGLVGIGDVHENMN